MPQSLIRTLGPLEAGSLDQAPWGAVGLYAWYARPLLGRGDWAEDVEFGQVESGVDRLLSVLTDHAARLTPPELEIKGKSPFGQRWLGSLSTETIQLERSQREALDAENQRSVLAELLSGATPLFAAPIYIGVTDNLRRRLNDHMGRLQAMYDARSREPEGWEPSMDLLMGEDADNIFAVRAVKAGFAPEHLVVWVMDLSGVSSSIGKQAALQIAESAEFTLNRWYRPLLGRR
jgi:hypothetical protein